MLLINSSVKTDNNSRRAVSGASQHLEQIGQPHEVANLPLTPSFSGNYITDTGSAPAGLTDFIARLERQQDHLYFVPTYYKSPPGMFKNYLDLVRMASLYHHKRVGIISTNSKNQDYGARQFMQTLLGLLEFHKAVTVIIPQILILDPDKVDKAAFQAYLTYFLSFPSPRKP